MTARVVVVGDVLLDQDIDGPVRRIAPDAPVPVVDIDHRTERPGGAGLAAVLLAEQGVDVTLVTALADDEPGRRLRALLVPEVTLVPALTAQATRCKTRVRSGGHSLLRLDTDSPAAQAGPDDLVAVQDLFEEADAVLVSDYAGGVVGHPGVRRLLADRASQGVVVWDPHPRGSEPVPGVTLVTPNRTEAEHFASSGHPAADRLAVELCRRWQAWAVAVTDGESGVALAAGSGPSLFVPVPERHRGDACGAGDRFAGAVTVQLAHRVTTGAAVEAAVRDTADWLAAGGVRSVGRTTASAALTAPTAGAPTGADHRGTDHRGADRIGLEQRVAASAGPDRSDAEPVGADGPEAAVAAAIRRVRAAGGTVVATGGCFDLLHAGHVTGLAAARELGDFLVVLLNSDASVRRLKGAARPISPVADRQRVLAALRSVDAVVVFDEDGPGDLLDRLRPDVWAKGGDYSAEMLPEAPVVTGWGGRVVLVPYLPGRSTTAIVEGRTS